jgi:hypothetical protein
MATAIPLDFAAASPLAPQLEDALRKLVTGAPLMPDERQILVRRLDELTIPPELANAPIDDEPVTPEDVAAIAEAREDVAQGRTTSLAEVRRKLGL